MLNMDQCAGLVATHCSPLSTAARRCIMLSTSAFPKSFINREPQARSLRPRRDASLPHPAQRLVASGSTGLERKQSRQSVGAPSSRSLPFFPPCRR